MIVVTDQMKYTMNNHPVQLILELGTIFDSILPDSIDTDEQVSRKFITLAVIKSDDICKIVMLKILLIYIQYILSEQNMIDMSPTLRISLSATRRSQRLFKVLPLKMKSVSSK